MAVWDASMHGVPWTSEKMRRAVKVLRAGASVSFAFDAEPIERLALLDAKVLAARPDLVLEVWGTSKSGRLDARHVDALAALAHVRHLKLGGVKGVRLEALGGLRALESIDVVCGGGKLDLGFLAPMKALRSVKLWGVLEDLGVLAQLGRLRSLALAGRLGDLSVLEGCARLESLRFGASTIRSLDFLARLGARGKLKELALDTATVAGSLAGIGEARALVDLSLTNNKNLRDVSFVAKLARLERLRIDQPHVVKLPDLSKLARLTTIELGSMKAWTTPEVLATAPRVKKVALTEINPKLTAERFFFLADARQMRSLAEVDIRFIDFAKKRRLALHAHFARAGTATRLAPEG